MPMLVMSTRELLDKGVGGGGRVLPIKANMGRLCQKGSLSGFRYTKGKGHHKLRYKKG